MNRYVIVAGETSGDQYGGQLMSEIKKISCGAVEFWGVGGKEMLNNGLNQLENIDKISIIGFSEAFKKMPSLVILSNRISQFVREVNPSSVILIDFPGFNLNLAKQIKKRSPKTKIKFFISPQIWAWNERRIKTIKKYIDQMIVIFPFEEKYYKKKKVDAIYVGHPFLDNWMPSDKKVLKKKLNLPSGKRVLGIFPGSRKQELKKHLPIYLEVIKKIVENDVDIECAIGLAPGFNKEEIINQYKILNIKIIVDDPLKLLECSDLAIVTSGTISLQATFMNTPCVVAYKLSWLSGYISKLLMKVKYISMTNIIANKMILPELIQSDVNANNLIKKIDKMMTDTKYYNSIKSGQKNIKKMFLNKSNAINNAAECIVNEKN
jgi:lipid-A-disaccharide synthase